METNVLSDTLLLGSVHMELFSQSASPCVTEYAELLFLFTSRLSSSFSSFFNLSLLAIEYLLDTLPPAIFELSEDDDEMP